MTVTTTGEAGTGGSSLAGVVGPFGTDTLLGVGATGIDGGGRAGVIVWGVEGAGLFLGDPRDDEETERGSVAVSNENRFLSVPNMLVRCLAEGGGACCEAAR